MPEATLRSPRPEEAARVAALVNELSVAVGCPPDTTPAEITAWWSGGKVDPLVADRGGDVVGFGYVFVRGETVRIDAGGEHQEALLDEVERRAAGRLARAVLHESDPRRALFAGRDYRVVRSSYDMEITLAGELEKPAWPEGIAARTARPGDERTFHRVQDEAFADHWGNEPRPYEDWATIYGGMRPFDPQLWLLAEEEREPVGVAICERGVEGDEETGWIHVIAVRRQWRGRGLGSALLRASFAALAEVGMRRAMLGVDAENTTGAVRLYERAGMRVVHRFETWERQLPTPSPPAAPAGQSPAPPPADDAEGTGLSGSVPSTIPSGPAPSAPPEDAGK